MSVSLASMRANLMPMQLRGPQPKGMWHIWGRLAFSSGVNLSNENCSVIVVQSQSVTKLHIQPESTAGYWCDNLVLLK